MFIFYIAGWLSFLSLEILNDEDVDVPQICMFNIFYFWQAFIFFFFFCKLSDCYQFLVNARIITLLQQYIKFHLFMPVVFLGKHLQGSEMPIQ